MKIGFKMQRPLITIITALHDADENILITYESISKQLSNKVHWLIKLSSSKITPNLEKIKSNSFIKIACINDSSLYEGLNQAIALCNSDWMMVLGSGDTLCNQAMEVILHNIDQYPLANAFFFSTKHTKNDFIIYPNPNEIHLRMACPHPSSLMKVNEIKQLNGFDCSYKIAADYDLISRYLIKYETYLVNNEVIVNFKGDGISELKALEGYLEEELIRSRIWNSTQIAICERAINYFHWANKVLTH